MRSSLFLSFLFISLSLNAQKYIWPTNASKSLTSVFGEFRPRHYHSGIDIKTWAKTGYEVYAIEDGEVIRVRVSPFGYGKALYIRLKDGNYAVYAHLERFNDKIEKLVRKIQHQKNRYSIQYYPKKGKIKVKKGEIIAWSGDTGIGVPHLHFEIRNPKNQPMNPLLFYPRLKDNIPPVFSRLAVIPLGKNSFVSGSPFPEIYFAERKNGTYRIPEVIPVSGAVTLGFVAYDAANGARNKFSVYRFELFEGDKKIFYAQYDYLDFNDTKFIELDRNYSLIRQKKGKFQQTWLHRYNKLPFYKTDSDSGKIAIGNGEIRDYKLIVYDFNGNKSALTVRLQGVPVLPLKAYAESSLGETSVYDLGEWGTFEDLTVEPQKYTSIKPRLIFDKDEKWRLMCSARPGEFLIKSVSKNLQIPLLWGGTANKIVSEKEVRIENKTLKGLITADNGIVPGSRVKIVFNGTDIPPLESFYRDRYAFQADLPPHDGVLSAVFNGSDTLFSEKIFYINPTHSRKIRQGLLEMKFPDGAFYDPAFVYRRVSQPNKKEYSSGLFYSLVYDVQPFLQPVNMGVKVAIYLPDSAKGNKHVGLFFFSDKNKWIFLAGSDGEKCESKVLSMERFALISDTIAPVIKPVTLARKKIFTRAPKKFIWKVIDEGAGFPGDENFSCELDGKKVIIEFDPEEDLLILPTFDLEIKKGKHIFLLSAEDNLNNRTTAKFEFSIKR